MCWSRIVAALVPLAMALNGQAAASAWTRQNVSRSLPLSTFWWSHSQPRPAAGGTAWILNWSTASHTLVWYDGTLVSYLTPPRFGAWMAAARSAPSSRSDWGPTSLSSWGSAVAFCASFLGFLEMTSSEIFYWEQGTIHRVTYDRLCDTQPSLYDGTIAWQSRACEDDDWEIRYWDGYGVRTITDNDVDDTHPSLYDGTIAWRSGMDIVYLSVPTSIYYPLGSPVAVAVGEAPSLFGDKIAYHASDGNDTEIFLYGIESGQTIQITDNDYNDRNACLYDGTLVWEGYDGNDWEIFYWDGSSTQQMTDNQLDDMEPSLWGTGLRTMVAYVEWRESSLPPWFASHIVLLRPALIISPGPGSGDMTLAWPSLEGRTYRVEYSDDLLTWHVAADDLPSRDMARPPGRTTSPPAPSLDASIASPKRNDSRAKIRSSAIIELSPAVKPGGLYNAPTLPVSAPFTRGRRGRAFVPRSVLRVL